MHIQSGKSGGPDVSGATETNQAFIADANGLMKVTCTGKPGEKHSLRLSANQSHGFKFVEAAQTQKSNGTVGWGTAGVYHAGGKSPGQGAQIANFDPSQNKGANFPSYVTAPDLILEIGADGNPITVTFGLGQKI